MGKQHEAVWRFKIAMRALTAIYILGAILFFFLSAFFSKVFGVPPEASHFWVVLSVSMMSMLAYVSWQSNLNPRDQRFVRVHLLSKWVSTLGFLLSFFFFLNLPAYLLAAGIDFGVILLITALRVR